MAATALRVRRAALPLLLANLIIAVHAVPPPQALLTSFRAPAASFANGGRGTLEQCPIGSFSTEVDAVYECLDCIINKAKCPSSCCSVEFKPASNQKMYCRIGGCCLRALTVDKAEIYVTEALAATKVVEGSTTCASLEENSECPTCAYGFLNGKDVTCGDEGYDIPARGDTFKGGSSCANGKKATTKRDVPADEDIGDFVPPADKTDKPQEEKPENTSGKSDRKPSGAVDAKGESETKDRSSSSAEKTKTSNEKEESNVDASNGKPLGAIVGGSVGGIVALLALCSLCVCCIRKSQRRKDENVPFPSIGKKHVTASAMPRISSLPPGAKLAPLMPPGADPSKIVQSDSARPSNARKRPSEVARQQDPPLHMDVSEERLPPRELPAVQPHGVGLPVAGISSIPAVDLAPTPVPPIRPNMPQMASPLAGSSSKQRKSPLDRPMPRTPPLTPPGSPGRSGASQERDTSPNSQNDERTPHPSELALNPATPEHGSRRVAFAADEFGELGRDDLVI